MRRVFGRILGGMLRGLGDMLRGLGDILRGLGDILRGLGGMLVFCIVLLKNRKKRGD